MKIHPVDLVTIFLAGAGLLICFIVGVSLLYRKKGIKYTNRILGILLVLYSFTTLNGLMAATGVLYQNKNLYFLPIVFSLSIGPLYYFFVKSKIEPSFKFKRKHAVHLVIPLLQFLFYLSIGFRSVEYKTMVWREIVYPYWQYIEEALLILSGLFYLLGVLALLKRKVPKQLWQKPVYRWLRTFTISFIILLCIHSGYEIASWIAFEFFSYNIYNSVWLVLPLNLADVGLSFVIGINAFIYQNQTLIIPKQDSLESSVEAKLLWLLEEEKIYLDPELNLDQIAKRLGISKNAISKSLSDKGQTFRGIINRYRVEEFINKAKSGEYQHLSLLGIAFDSGFNSKASFNRIFKELKGESPTSYFS